MLTLICFALFVCVSMKIRGAGGLFGRRGLEKNGI